MEILGIGPLEILFILLIAFVVLGPGDMAKTGRTIGLFLRKVVMSPWWSGLRNVSREVSQLPYKLMREAAIEETVKELTDKPTIDGNIIKSPSNGDNSDFSSWTNSNFLSDTSLNETVPRKFDSHR